jgi:oxygen-dependent protoporphyrinogen oxidase
MARVGVIGGGLAGLIVACRRAASGDTVVVLDPAPRMGGQLWTAVTDGFVIEHGAEGFVANSATVPKLADDLGIEGELIGQNTLLSYGFDGARLIPLAPGEAGAFLGFQVSSDDLGRGIRTFRRGMGQLIEALLAGLQANADLRPATQVRTIELGRNAVHLDLDRGGALEVDVAVVATPARTAAALLAPALGGGAEEPAAALASAAVVSILTVSLAYQRDAIDHPLDATGFVVADPTTVGGMRACTFTSSKFTERAPNGHASLRLFFRPDARDIERLSDAEWTARAHDALGRVLGVRAAPLRAWVSRWPHALPVFSDEHRARVTALESALAGRRILLAGSAFHGSGIDRAVQSAETCATLV